MSDRRRLPLSYIECRANAILRSVREDSSLSKEAMVGAETSLVSTGSRKDTCFKRGMEMR